MKKFLVLLVALAVMIAVFVSCDNGKEKNTTTEEAVTTTENADSTTVTDETTTAETTTETTTTEEITTTDPIVDSLVGEQYDAPYAGDFTVSNAFGDNMVVQRNEHIRVWGFADATENGKKVSGEFMGMTSDALIENGKWTLVFTSRQKANAKLGNSMKIFTDKKTVEFKDVLVGDVYMVIGQSNTEYDMNSYFVNTKKNISSLDLTLPIRLNHINYFDAVPNMKRGTADVNDNPVKGDQWKKIGQSTIGDINWFSAIGYLFGNEMAKRTNGEIPVGLIELGYSGMPIGAFLPNEVAEATKADRWSDSKGYYVTGGVNGDASRFLYNHYLAPYANYAIAGIVWYQGESDCDKTMANTYVKKFVGLMEHLRSTHNLINKDFPVFIMEFPSSYTQPQGYVDPTGGSQPWQYMDFGYIRAEMGSIPLKLNNSYICVSSDLWNDRTFWNGLHPYCKDEQAKRLATMAEAVVLGRDTMNEGAGPQLVKYEVSEDRHTVVLTFTNVGDGLKTIDGSENVLGFNAVKSNGDINDRAKNITAKITAKDQVTIELKEYTMFGIAYDNITTNFFGKDLNLCNSEGVPAGAFIYAEKRMG